MAVPKENLLSLGHLTCTERNTFTKQREHKLKKSITIPVPLQADISTLQSHQHLRGMRLQHRWEELKERELAAKQHNKQLLQQFEEAQDTLRKMLTLTSTMKTIRMEYERYVEESSPRWEQQLKEKTQAAQRKRMEDYLKSYLKNTEDPVTESFADQSLLSQGPTTKPQRMSASQKHHSQNSHLDYNQDGSWRLPYMQSSLQTHPQSQAARFPIRVPYHSQGSSHAPSSFLSPPVFSHPFQLHHLTSTPAHHQPWPGQNLPGQAFPQSDYPRSWIAGAAGIPSGSEALWGQLYTEEPPPERVEAELSIAASSKRERGGGSRSSHSSQELDIKPVRLSSGAAESSESSRESSQTSRDRRKKREKRGRSRRTSSERERCSSHESSLTSTVIITAAVTGAQSSESDASSEKGRTSMSRRRTAGLDAGSPTDEKVVKERTRNNGDDSGSHKEESQSTAEESRSEEAGGRSPDDKPESCGEELGSQREEESESVSIEIENGGVDEIEKERSSSEESSAGEKDDEENNEEDVGEGDEEVDDGEEKEDSQRDEQQEETQVKNDDEEASDRRNTTEEEEEQQSEDEMEEQEPEEESDHEAESDKLKNEGSENGKQGSASSQDEEVDEDESEGREDEMEEDEESDEEEKGGEEEEEQKIDEAEAEDRDSEDSIISPQNKSKRMHVIPEEESEDEDEDEEEGSKTGSCDDEVKEFCDEDIEHLLAPQEQPQKKGEKDLRAEEKPTALCNKVEIFQVELDRPTKTDHPSDSEEFDHFYD